MSDVTFCLLLFLISKTDHFERFDGPITWPGLKHSSKLYKVNMIMKNEASYSYKYNLNSSAVNSITRKENSNVSLFWTPWFFLAERESFPSWFVCTRLQMDCSHFGRNKAKWTCVLFIPNKVGVKAQKLGCTVRQWKSNFHCATCVHTILQQYSMCSNSQTLPNKPFYVSSVAFCVPRFSNPNNPSSQSKVKKPQRKEKKKKKKRKKKQKTADQPNLTFLHRTLWSWGGRMERRSVEFEYTRGEVWFDLRQ